MKKTAFALTTLLALSTGVSLVNAQNATASTSAAQGANLIGEAIAIVGIVALFSVLAYAGYKMIKKWSSPQD